jgi:hypothetical protein
LGLDTAVACVSPGRQTFAVHWRDDGGGVDTAAYINLDGTVVPGRFLFGRGETYRDAMRSGPSSERPFMFSKVDTARQYAQITGSCPPTYLVNRFK